MTRVGVTARVRVLGENYGRAGSDGPAREALLSPIGPRGPMCRGVINMSVQSLITRGLQRRVNNP